VGCDLGGDPSKRQYRRDPKSFPKDRIANTAVLHMHRRAAKYVFPPSGTFEVDGIVYKSKLSNYAARVDIHPYARSLFRGADRVFFVIEGCLKGDAVLSAGGPVLSVPSVTLWDT
jgi:hypothetical protein